MAYSKYTKISVEDLYEILVEHTKWVNSEGKEGEKAVLGIYDFKGIDFEQLKKKDSSLNFTHIDFTNARMIDMKFDNLDMSGCDFSKADLIHLSFNNTVLKGSDFSMAILSGCSFKDCVLDMARAYTADIQDTKFVDTSAKSLMIYNSSLTKGNFFKVDLSDSHLVGCDMADTYFTIANLHDVDFRRSDLAYTRLWDNDITTCRFDSSRLPDNFCAVCVGSAPVVYDYVRDIVIWGYEKVISYVPWVDNKGNRLESFRRFIESPEFPCSDRNMYLSAYR